MNLKSESQRIQEKFFFKINKTTIKHHKKSSKIFNYNKNMTLFKNLLHQFLKSIIFFLFKFNILDMMMIIIIKPNRFVSINRQNIVASVAPNAQNSHANSTKIVKLKVCSPFLPSPKAESIPSEPEVSAPAIPN